jgi:putative endonuclease
MREHIYFVYILASRRNGTLYVGVTNDVVRRTYEHKNDLIEGFTKKYGVHILVWYEAHGDINTAVTREKRLKRWNRAWKIKLIEEHNSGWNDLYDRMMGEGALPDFSGMPQLQTHLSSPASREAVREGDPGGETVSVSTKR